MHALIRFTSAGFIVLAIHAAASAGMPSPFVAINEVPRMRLENVSFFLLAFLVVAWLVQRLWNYLQRDFPRLPRLGYGRALALTTLWALLFVLVLTMISGARELMTPGAWEKDGVTYKLKEGEEPPAASPTERERENRLMRLRTALWAYARGHDNRFPSTREAAEIPSDRWELPDNSGTIYVYVPGLVADRGNWPLAYEPPVFGKSCLVLLTNGEVRSMEFDVLLQALPPEARR
jgi:hypothetical protein